MFTAGTGPALRNSTIKKVPMKNKSTYSLLINADTEEKSRSIFEAATYALVVCCMAVSVWHFAASPVTLPKKSQPQDQPKSMIANAPVQEAAPVIASRG